MFNWVRYYAWANNKFLQNFSPKRPDQLWSPSKLMLTDTKYFVLALKCPEREANNSTSSSDEAEDERI
jgi:hypothetical protein